MGHNGAAWLVPTMLDIGKYLLENIGTLPGWVLIGIVVAFWWQGLPNFIKAWEARSSGIEARLQASVKTTLERYDALLEEADEHRVNCIREQKELRNRISDQDLIIATQNGTIASQTNTIVKMAEEIKGLHISNLQQQTELANRIKDRV